MRQCVAIRPARSRTERGLTRTLHRSAWVISLVALLTAPAAWPLASGPGQIKVEKTGSGFDATATLRNNGRLVRVKGPITCTKDMALRIDVTLTQRKSGALGRGTWRGVCTGAAQRWTLDSVRAVGGRGFTAGPVKGCAAASLRNSEGPVDAVQWCDTVRLRRS